MKKAFEQNVSRAKPRLRLGAALTEIPAEPEPADEVAALPAEPQVPVAAELAAQVKARVEQAQRPKMSAAEAIQLALTAPMSEPERMGLAASLTPQREQVEIQNPIPPPEMSEDPDPDSRRERLRERLRAVRENPRPEPLPANVSEAGALAVERISALQGELGRVKAVNLALTQDLELARRQSEKATEEARVRIDEARRLSMEMDQRAKLLSELEKELESLEGERDDALLALQESRQALDGAAKEREELKEEISKRDAALSDALSEEERIAAELEGAKEEAGTLRRSVDALTHERDTLARQVSSLTAEVSELLAARKALEAVHRALSSASVR